MNIVAPSFEIIEQNPGLEGIYEQIELAGRTCYKSERKEGTTAKDFVDKMIASKHYAMLEHGTVYLKLNKHDNEHVWDKFVDKYTNNPYTKINYVNLSSLTTCITTNMRILVENEWLDDLEFLCEPTEFHEKRVCVKFITDRAIANEIVRHRKFSFAQESSRYCNYSKNQFNSEISICENQDVYINKVDYYVNGLPLEELWGNYYGSAENLFALAVRTSEFAYMELLNRGWKPEQARRVLPLCTKTELVMTGFISDWENFFLLRVDGITGRPHPDILLISKPLKDEFINKGYIRI